VHPVFLLGLLVLILNDHVLKQQYHNVITGKLSDFSGLFIFPLFWATLLPKFRKLVYALTALLFIYWKSTWSQPLLDWLSVHHMPLMRVADYTDLIALSVLPISYQFFITVGYSYKKEMLVVPVAVISFFAFCATSAPYQFMPPDVQNTYYKTFKTTLNREELLTKLDLLGFRYSIDTGYKSYIHKREEEYIENHVHDSTCTMQEYVTIKNLVYKDDTLQKVFIGHSNYKNKNRIVVYGYRVDDTSNLYADYKKYKGLIKVYTRLINEGVIEKIRE
jgi:hypothetical protein